MLSFPGVYISAVIKMLKRTCSFIFPFKEIHEPIEGNREIVRGAEWLFPLCLRISRESKRLCPLCKVMEESIRLVLMEGAERAEWA